ncbi:MAG: dihydroorotase [Fermentimonas sp.]
MTLIHRATVINEGEIYEGSLLLKGQRIARVIRGEVAEPLFRQCRRVIDARGLWLLPGVIDDHVHFREPGLTRKGDMFTESRAAVAGGVTSCMEMPNTVPQTITIEALEQKFERAASQSMVNYSFYLGATNGNLSELKKVDPKTVCGVKLFMGASTGNMLVDNVRTLQAIFAEIDALIAAHCEQEDIIRENIALYEREFGQAIPIEYHPLIRSAEACYRSSAEAVELADKYGTRLHVLHLSTERELSLFDVAPVEEKKITSEACVHHLWFTDEDYARLGSRVKWTPAIKTQVDREALREGLKQGKLDVVATDHAPHLLKEKEGGALQAASGGPLLQHSLQAMLELAIKGVFSKEQVVEKLCHAPAKLFHVKERGYIREGYYADLVLVDPTQPHVVSDGNVWYKCGWSPFQGETFGVTVSKTFVNGQLVYNEGQFDESFVGEALRFNR